MANGVCIKHDGTKTEDSEQGRKVKVLILVATVAIFERIICFSSRILPSHYQLKPVNFWLVP